VSPGSREALRASVDYDNVSANEPDRFDLVVQRVRTRGSERIEDQEIFRRLSIAPGTARFISTALQDSGLVRVRGPVPGQRPDQTFLKDSRHSIGYVDSNPDGDDGLPLTDYDVIGSPVTGAGLFALARVEDLHFVCIPPLSRERERLAPAGQRDRRRYASVHDAHDYGVAAAAVEELLDRVGERARLPEPAEQVVELGETVDGDGAVDRAAQRAADERGHGSRTTRNGAVRAGPFGDDNAAEGRIAQAAPALCG
jgi:hypothetical protein